MHRLSHRTLSFDEFSLDLTRGCLMHRQEVLKLRPKSFEVLKYLVQNDGRLISKGELMQAIWGDTAVTDDSLVQCMKDVRHALGDEAQRIIKTVHRRGYILDSEVIDSGVGVRLDHREETADPQVNVEELVMNRYGVIEAAVKDSGQTVIDTNCEPPLVGTLRPITRLMVLPFRMLRPDPAIDFLGFSVPDAVAGTLSMLDSMVVRSPAGAARYVNKILDLNRIAEEARAEAVLTGTILRAGNRIRVSCQLLETPSGTVLWWHDEPDMTIADLFELQDNLVNGIVESLSLSLSTLERRRLSCDVPTTAAVFELYLRGNELSRRGLAGFRDLTIARDLYRSCVEADPLYAPAWAQLGRCYRLIGKGIEGGCENLKLAESAFVNALDLNHDLPLGHCQYAFLEAELGRAKEAVVRLLGCARTGSTSPELFAALVLCCRFCGLLDHSLAAHERARQLDPLIATSVSHTYYQLGDYDRALHHVGEGAWAIAGMTLGTMGRTVDSLASFRNTEKSRLPTPMQSFIGAWRAMLEGNCRESLAAAEQCIQHYLDPEGVFYMGLIIARLGETERALTVVSESMDRGFSPVHALQHHPWFDGLRSTLKFVKLVERAKVSFIEADKEYRAAGGPQVLGSDCVVAKH